MTGWDVAERNRLVEQWMPLVKRIARPYARRAWFRSGSPGYSHDARDHHGARGHIIGEVIPLDDIVQAGMFGLMRAAERWLDGQAGGHEWVHYASMFIKKEVVRFVFADEKGVRLPVNANSERARFLKVRRLMAASLGRTPSVSEVIDRMGVKVPKARRRIAAMVRLIDADINSGWSELCKTPGRSTAPEDEADARIVAARVNAALGVLTEKQRGVIHRLYVEGKGLAEVAREDCVSSQAIQHTRDRALATLRKTLGAAA